MRSVRFAVLGVPVEVHPSFALVLLLLGLGPDATLPRIVAWVVIAAVGVLAHEMGHAIAVRRVGGRPSIVLYAMGGATTYARSAGKRTELLFVSAAGPAVGIVLGLIALFVRGDGATDDFTDYLLLTAIWVNLGWGVLNLAPLLPLDGGQIVQSMLPGDEAARLRRARLLSVAVAAGLFAVAIRFGYPFGALIAVYFGFTNVSALRAPNRAAERRVTLPDPDALLTGDFERIHDDARLLARHAPDLGVQAYARHWLAAALMGLGRGDEAMAELTALDRDGIPVDPTLAALGLIATGHDETGRARLATAHVTDSSPFFSVVAHYAASLGGNLPTTLETVCGSPLRPAELTLAREIALARGGRS